jgi:hypothetical protein
VAGTLGGLLLCAGAGLTTAGARLRPGDRLPAGAIPPPEALVGAGVVTLLVGIVLVLIAARPVHRTGPDSATGS